MVTHDATYAVERGECAAKDLAQLRLFLRWARRIGYEFRTIDTYVEDDPDTTTETSGVWGGGKPHRTSDFLGSKSGSFSQNLVKLLEKRV